MKTRTLTLRTKEEKETIKRLWADNLALPKPKSGKAFAEELGIKHTSFYYIVDPEYREKARERAMLRSRSKGVGIRQDVIWEVDPKVKELQLNNGFGLKDFLYSMKRFIDDYEKLVKEREAYKKTMESLQIRTGKLMEDIDNLARRGN